MSAEMELAQIWHKKLERRSGRFVNILVVNRLGRAEEDEIRWSPRTSNAEKGIGPVSANYCNILCDKQ